VQFEIETRSGFGAPAIQVAVNRGRCHPQRKPPSQSGSPRGLSLSGHCTGKSAVMPAPASKRCMNASTARHVWDCADVKTSAKFEKGVRRGILNTLTTWAVYCKYSEHSHNMGRVFIFKKCLVRAMSPKKMGGVTPLKIEVWKHTHTFILHTLYPTRPASRCHAVRFCPRTSSRRRIGVTTNSPTKNRVEVVQLNSCYTTINWK